LVLFQSGRWCRGLGVGYWSCSFCCHRDVHLSWSDEFGHNAAVGGYLETGMPLLLFCAATPSAAIGMQHFSFLASLFFSGHPQWRWPLLHQRYLGCSLQLPQMLLKRWQL
jgi:hypothetical protein